MKLEVKVILECAAIPHSDVHVAIRCNYRLDETLDMVVGEVQHVAIDEEEHVEARMLDAETHGVTLSLIFQKVDGANLSERTGDLDRAVSRPVTHDDDFVDQRVVREDFENFCNRLFLIEGGHNGADTQAVSVLLDDYLNESGTGFGAFAGPF